MAETNIIATFTSLYDYTNLKPVHQKVGDIIVSHTTTQPRSSESILDMSSNGTQFVEPRQALATVVLSNLFEKDLFLDSGLMITNDTAFLNGNPLTYAFDDLKYNLSIGSMTFDTATKKLACVCYNENDLSEFSGQVGVQLINEPFYAHIYKSSNIPSGYLDAYDILKPFVGITDSVLDAQVRSIAVDDGAKITFFSDKYIRFDRVY